MFPSLFSFIILLCQYHLQSEALAKAKGLQGAEDKEPLAEGEKAVQEIYNIILIYTFLTLIRHPGIRSEAAANERAELQTIHNQFMDESLPWLCVPSYLEEAEAILKSNAGNAAHEKPVAAKGSKRRKLA